jgi:predicted DNA-binding protein
MKTFTMKMPDGLLAWLEKESRRRSRPKSALVREILEQHQRQGQESALDLANDLCGCVDSRRGDLSHNRKYLKNFGR